MITLENQNVFILQRSGLSIWIGDKMTVFEDLNNFLMVLLIGLLSGAFTQFTNNMAAANILLPVVSSMVCNKHFDWFAIIFNNVTV